MKDVVDFEELTNEKLVRQFDNLRHRIEELEAGRKILAEEIVSRMKDDGEVWGQYSVTKVKKNIYSKITIETAESLGAVKKAVDTEAIKKLVSKGIAVEGLTTVVYPLVKYVEAEEEV